MAKGPQRGRVGNPDKQPKASQGASRSSQSAAGNASDRILGAKVLAIKVMRDRYTQSKA